MLIGSTQRRKDAETQRAEWDHAPLCLVRDRSSLGLFAPLGLCAFALIASALVGCAGDPQRTIDAYAEALRTKDAEQVWLLSDTAFRRAHDRAEVEAILRDRPDEVERLLRAIEAAGALRATIELEGGGRLTLVKEEGGWRVSHGGLEPSSAETPEAALRTFFRAAESRRLDVLRTVMPEAFVAGFADDAALDAHLSAVKPRIEAAQKALPAIRPNMAQIEGDRAFIAYGAGKKVELVREGDRWRVVDLE
jgi:hypothetical protein